MEREPERVAAQVKQWMAEDLGDDDRTGNAA
jgi:hypothetical protein